MSAAFLFVQHPNIHINCLVFLPNNLKPWMSSERFENKDEYIQCIHWRKIM